VVGKLLWFSDIDTPGLFIVNVTPMENKVTLTMKEQHKLKMVIDYEAGKIHAQKAAELLGISKRQFRRLVAAYRLTVACRDHLGLAAGGEIHPPGATGSSFWIGVVVLRKLRR
jgi:predicted DNA-binding protein (UPF0251 family)